MLSVVRWHVSTAPVFDCFEAERTGNALRMASDGGMSAYNALSQFIQSVILLNRVATLFL